MIHHPLLMIFLMKVTLYRGSHNIVFTLFLSISRLPELHSRKFRTVFNSQFHADFKNILKKNSRLNIDYDIKKKLKANDLKS